MSLIDQVVEVMSDHKGGAHVDEIADMLIARFKDVPQDREVLSGKVSAALATDVKKPKGKALFAKIKNKNGSLKRGIYRLKATPKITPKQTVAPDVGPLFTGKAGEMAVMSELLFYGFNASSMTIDDGIDIVASKKNKHFYIQVKTANATDGGAFSFSIKQSSFIAKESFDTFYVFVMREFVDTKYCTDYAIFPSSQIRQFINSGIIRDGSVLSLRIQRAKKGQYVLNAKHDITIHINQFSQLV